MRLPHSGDNQTESASLPRQSRPTAIRRSGWRGRLTTALLSLLLSAITLEVAARAYWRFGFGVPFRQPGRVLYATYPELKPISANPTRRGDGQYDVLFLGGSSLNRDWGHVQPALREELARHGQRNARIVNLARPGHTSRDSWLKYATLDAARFDLVVLYHGVNETRVNNAPPDIFRDDYGHYGWYELANALVPYHGKAKFALPYTVHRIAIGVRQAARKDRYVSLGALRPDWIQHGKHPGSVAPFERNLSEIIALAEQRGDPLVLMTFASYVPDNYSIEAFEEKTLDYGLHLTAIETWGAREHVLATLEAHNRVVRKLAERHPGTLYADQAELMRGVPGYFNDVCHFTLAGSVRFAQNLVSGLSPVTLGVSIDSSGGAISRASAR